MKNCMCTRASIDVIKIMIMIMKAELNNLTVPVLKYKRKRKDGHIAQGMNGDGYN